MLQRELIVVPGFRFGGLNIGLKNDSLDFGGIVADGPCQVAAVFTRNNFPGAPVIVGREHVSDGRLQAVVVNSKNANVATGPSGVDAARKTCIWFGDSLGIDPRLVLPSSTGVIGRPLNTEKIQRGCVQLSKQLGAGTEFSERFARAIMTTDHHPKWANCQLQQGGSLLGIAKGAGMIEPNMATMLAYLVTDAEVQGDLQSMLRQAVDQSFNRISIDTDTSTSDTVVLLCRGTTPTDAEEFQQALNAVCLDLAQQIVRDGEGATKLLEVTVSGAQTSEVALKFGKAIINSPLVKTAMYGADPNWGRFVMAIGKVFDYPVPLEELKIWFGEGAERLCLDSAHAENPQLLEKLRPLLQRDRIRIQIEVGRGHGSETVWGCDLSEGYVSENAYYTT